MRRLAMRFCGDDASRCERLARRVSATLAGLCSTLPCRAKETTNWSICSGPSAGNIERTSRRSESGSSTRDSSMKTRVFSLMGRLSGALGLVGFARRAGSLRQGRGGDADQLGLLRMHDGARAAFVAALARKRPGARLDLQALLAQRLQQAF